MLTSTARFGLGSLSFAANIASKNRLFRMPNAAVLGIKARFSGRTTGLFRNFPSMVTRNALSLLSRTLPTTCAPRSVHHSVQFGAVNQGNRIKYVTQYNTSLNMLYDKTEVRQPEGEGFKQSSIAPNTHLITTQPTMQAPSKADEEPLSTFTPKDGLENAQSTTEQRFSNATPQPRSPPQLTFFAQNMEPLRVAVSQQEPIHIHHTRAIYNSSVIQGGGREPAQRPASPQSTLNLDAPQNRRIAGALQPSTREPLTLRLAELDNQVTHGAQGQDFGNAPDGLVLKRNIVERETIESQSQPEPTIPETLIPKTENKQPSPNIDELAEKIFRLIERKNRIERERRGC